MAEALAIISSQGVPALSMRGLATPLGVVPGALYRHVHSKEELYDLVLDAVLAEVDPQVDNPSPGPRRSPNSPSGCGPFWSGTPASPAC